MNIRRLKDKAVAALITIVFMALIRTNAGPSLWEVTMISIALYECAQYGIRTIRQQRKAALIMENNRKRRIEGKRIENQRFRKVG